MSLIQLMLDAQIGRIPRQYLNAAEKYAEGVATSTNYTLNQAAREALNIGSRLQLLPVVEGLWA